MADEQEVEETTTTTTQQKSAIDEFDLDLTLGLRPLNSTRFHDHDHHHHHNNLPESNGQIISKREQQAIRRHEAKVKRDFKRKAASLSAAKYGVVFQEEQLNDEERDEFSERRRKGVNLGFQQPFAVAPPCWLGNAGGFRPYQGQNGKIEGGGDGEIRSSGSSGSSSGISDNYHSNNNSAAGGNSSDTSSHSSHSLIDLPAANVPTVSSSVKQPVSSHQQSHTNCSNHNLSLPQLGSSRLNQTDILLNSSQCSKSPDHVTSPSIIPQPSENLSKGTCTSDKEPTPNPRGPSPNETKPVTGKPPKPNNGQMSQQSPVPQMPCVSTTGNGPNGKTITGFLYKYSKTEVSIICVCHGASFSPASFVEHAGGVDVEHPLKHIRVVPFALS